MSSEEGGLVNNQMADDGSISPMHKTQNGNGNGMFYDAATNEQDQDDSDDQVDDDGSDLIDDDIIDEEAALEL